MLYGSKVPMVPGSNMSYADAAMKRDEDRVEDVQKKQSKGKPLQPLQIGDVVRVQDPITKLWDTKAKVIAVREHGRSYLLKKTNGVYFVRNRKFIKVWKGRETEDGQDLPQVDTPIPKFIARRSPRIAESKKKNKIDLLGYNSEVVNRTNRSISSHQNTDKIRRLTEWTMSRKVQDPVKPRAREPTESPRPESLRSARSAPSRWRHDSGSGHSDDSEEELARLQTVWRGARSPVNAE